MEEIKKMEPEGFIEYPRRPPIEVHADSIHIVEQPVLMDDSVSFLNTLLLWIRENFITEIIQSKSGVIVESKLWYASKTLWVNLIGILGVFLTPLIGLTLTPELVATVLVVINAVLRLITKKEVVFS